MTHCARMNVASLQAEYTISHCHCPSLSSWNSLAQIRKKASGAKPRGPQWATESEEERLEQWRWLMLHSGKTDRTCSVVAQLVLSSRMPQHPFTTAVLSSGVSSEH